MQLWQLHTASASPRDHPNLQGVGRGCWCMDLVLFGVQAGVVRVWWWFAGGGGGGTLRIQNA